MPLKDSTKQDQGSEVWTYFECNRLARPIVGLMVSTGGLQLLLHSMALSPVVVLHCIISNDVSAELVDFFMNGA